MEKRSADELRAPKDNAEISLLMAPGRVVVFHVRVRKLNYSHDSLPKLTYPLTSCVCGLIIRVMRYYTNVPKTCSTENLLFLDLMPANVFNYSPHRRLVMSKLLCALFQSESSCKTFRMKTNLIRRNLLRAHFHVNEVGTKTRFDTEVDGNSEIDDWSVRSCWH